MPQITFYQSFLSNVGGGNINLATDDYKVILVNGYVFDPEDDRLSDVQASEITEANGYTTGGELITNTTWGWVPADSVTRWDGDDVTWSASGGSIVADGAIIYSDTSVSKNVVCYIDFGQQETAGDSTDFKLTFNINGLCQIAES